MTDAMIDMDTIMAGLDDQVRTNILILDACRNNPMAPQVASAGPAARIEAGSGLAAPATLGAGSTLGAGTLIAFATAPGQVALDGEGANSPFSAALSRHIGTPGLEVQQMLTRVRAEVVAATKSQAGAVVELVAAGRGLSGGEVRFPQSARSLARRRGLTLQSGRRTTALGRIPDSVRTSHVVRKVPPMTDIREWLQLPRQHARAATTALPSSPVVAIGTHVLAPAHPALSNQESCMGLWVAYTFFLSIMRVTSPGDRARPNRLAGGLSF